MTVAVKYEAAEARIHASGKVGANGVDPNPGGLSPRTRREGLRRADVPRAVQATVVATRECVGYA